MTRRARVQPERSPSHLTDRCRRGSPMREPGRVVEDRRPDVREGHLPRAPRDQDQIPRKVPLVTDEWLLPARPRSIRLPQRERENVREGWTAVVDGFHDDACKP